MGHTNSHWRLTPLVLVDLDQTRNLLDIGAGEARCNDVLDALIVLHVARQNRIQHRVLRQAVLIGLIRSQLGAGGARDDALGDRRAAVGIGIIGIAPACQRKHRRLGQVLDHRKTTCHVAIQRAIAGRHLRLVAGRQHDSAKFIRQGHQQGAPDTSLYVLFGRVLGQPLELAGQRQFEGFKLRHDRNLVVAHTESLRHLTRIDPTDIRRVGRRHHDRANPIFSQRVDGKRQHQRRVDAA